MLLMQNALYSLNKNAINNTIYHVGCTRALHCIIENILKNIFICLTSGCLLSKDKQFCKARVEACYEKNALFKFPSMGSFVGIILYDIHMTINIRTDLDNRHNL